jgi:hypothetical protein
MTNVDTAHLSEATAAVDFAAIVSKVSKARAGARSCVLALGTVAVGGGTPLRIEAGGSSFEGRVFCDAEFEAALHPPGIRQVVVMTIRPVRASMNFWI